jgi:two-component system, cell cycle sensor histidine kinase and response regulator CckA
MSNMSVDAKSVRQSYQAALDEVADAVVFAEGDGRIVHANRAAMVLLPLAGRGTGAFLDEILAPFDTDGNAFRFCEMSLGANLPFKASPRDASRLTVLEGTAKATTEEILVVMRPAAVKEDVGIHRQSFKPEDERLGDLHRSEYEERLRHAQKMEILGRLTGGVAHNFNNLLMVIMSYAQLLEESIPADSSDQRYIQQIIGAANKAAENTHQLLTFSRRRKGPAQVVDLSKLVREACAMLPYITKGAVTPKLLLPERQIWVHAGPDQITQIVLNLCTNAVDAMPEGGVLTVGLEPGKPSDLGDQVKARLSISDTGIGMPREVQQRIFEPFFTTKEPGKGTGLGLSTVVGIVEELSGAISVESEVGRGSKFQVELPESNAVPQTEQPREVRKETRRRVLLVEDEEGFRNAAREYLQHAGYQVTASCNATDALYQAGAAELPFDVLVTDIRMP